MTGQLTFREGGRTWRSHQHLSKDYPVDLLSHVWKRPHGARYELGEQLLLGSP